MNLAIVIIAYNRPKSLKNLLNSLARAQHSNESSITLIISIDKSNDDSVLRVAQNFTWNAGQKIIIAHKVNMGLKNHVLSCGDLSNKYDSIIMLEDDLCVSPFYFDYVKQSLKYFNQDIRIAGISLFEQRYNEIAACPFEPINDGYDNYFMQVPCSWGQVFTKKQWIDFRSFIDNYELNFDNSKLPQYVLGWNNSTSWKKYLYEYLIINDLYFVYPKFGLTTNSGDSGTHYEKKIVHLQSSLLLKDKEFNFSTLDNSLAIYDAYHEFSFKGYYNFFGVEKNLEFDINGTKPLENIKSQFLFSTKLCNNPICIFSIDYYPYENNILLENKNYDINHGTIAYGLTTDFMDSNPNFDRLFNDANRIFGNVNFIKEIYENRIEYKIINTLLFPLRLAKKFL